MTEFWIGKLRGMNAEIDRIGTIAVSRFSVTGRTSFHVNLFSRGERGLVSGNWILHFRLCCGSQPWFLTSGRERADSQDPQTNRGQYEKNEEAAMSSRSPLNTDSSCAIGAGQMELGHGGHSRGSRASVAISQTVTKLLLILDDEGLARTRVQRD